MSHVDVARYVERVGYVGALEPTLETLRALHLAHVTRVPFENLDIHLGRTAPCEPPACFAKIVHERRGGACVEQNGVWVDVLRALGFDARPLAARVDLGLPVKQARIHMSALVVLDGRAWLADVGFAGHPLLGPVPLVDGAEHAVHGDVLRCARSVPASPWENAEWTLSLATGPRKKWKCLYRLSLDPVEWPTDFWWNAHAYASPQLPYAKHKIVSTRRLDGRRLVLWDRELRTWQGDDVQVEPVTDEAAYYRLLHETFGLELSAASALW